MKRFNEEEQERLLEYQMELSVAQTRVNTYLNYMAEKYKPSKDEVITLMGYVKKPKQV